MSTATLAPEDFEDITCENVLADFNTEQLEILAFEKDIKFRSRQNEDQKEALIDAVGGYVRNSGQKKLIFSFSKTELKQFCECISESKTRNESKNNKGEKTWKSKQTLAKRMWEQVTDLGGMKAYLQQYDKQRFIELSQLLVLIMTGEETDVSSRNKLWNTLNEELESYFLRSFLSVVPVAFLRSVCSTPGFRINVEGCNSANIIAECIIQGQDYVPSESYLREVEEPHYSKKPKRGITSKCNKSDLLQWFLASELKEFCDENELRNTGKKVEVAQRIIEFFDPEKENKETLMKGYKKPKKVKKDAGRKRRQSRVGTDVPEEEPLTERKSKKTSSKKSNTKKNSRKSGKKSKRDSATDSFESFSDDGKKSNKKHQDSDSSDWSDSM